MLNFPERERLWVRVERLLAEVAAAHSEDFKIGGQSHGPPPTNISPWQPKAKCQAVVLAPPALAVTGGGLRGAHQMRDQQLGWLGDLEPFSGGVGGVNGFLPIAVDQRWEVAAPGAMLGHAVVAAPGAMLGHAVSLAHAVVAPNNTLALAMDMNFMMHRP